MSKGASQRVSWLRQNLCSWKSHEHRCKVRRWSMRFITDVLAESEAPPSQKTWVRDQQRSFSASVESSLIPTLAFRQAKVVVVEFQSTALWATINIQWNNTLAGVCPFTKNQMPPTTGPSCPHGDLSQRLEFRLTQRAQGNFLIGHDVLPFSTHLYERLSGGVLTSAPLPRIVSPRQT